MIIIFTKFEADATIRIPEIPGCIDIYDIGNDMPRHHYTETLDHPQRLFGDKII